MPKTTVAAIILQKKKKDSKILLARRNINPFKNLWCLPGGHIDKFELARDAIQREVKEEVGVNFDGIFFKYFDEIIPSDGIHAVVLAFIGLAQGEIVKETPEVSEIKWFAISEIKKLKLAFQHAEILDDYIKNIDVLDLF